MSESDARPPILTRRGSLLGILALLAVNGCHDGHSAASTAPTASAAPSSISPTMTAAVDAVRLAHAADEPDQWLTPGRDPRGTYFSPLTDINADNVARLGFAWQ